MLGIIQEENTLLCNSPTTQRNKEGTAVLIKKEIAYKRLNKRKTLQVVVLDWKKKYNMFNLSICNKSLGAAPMILLKYFNAHNPLQGNNKKSTKSRIDNRPNVENHQTQSFQENQKGYIEQVRKLAKLQNPNQEGVG